MHRRDRDRRPHPADEVQSLVVDVSNWRVALLVCSLTTLAGTVAFAVLAPRSRFFTPKAASVRATVQ